MKRVTGKVALVTGGAMGMGKSHSELLAAEGAKVFVCDIDVENGKQVVEAIRSQGGDAEFLRLDVSNEADWKAAVTSMRRPCFSCHTTGADSRSSPFSRTTRRLPSFSMRISRAPW